MFTHQFTTYLGVWGVIVGMFFWLLAQNLSSNAGEALTLHPQISPMT